MKKCGVFKCPHYDASCICNCDVYNDYVDDYDCFVEEGKFVEWVDVSKLLPKHDQKVLMYCEWPDGDDHIADGVYHKNGKFFTVYGTYENPVAWMPRLKDPDFI